MYPPRVRVACLASILAIAAGTAAAGDKVLIQPVPGWVKFIGKLNPAASADDDVALMDIQQKADRDGVTTFGDIAVRATSAQALASIGTISQDWYPDKGDLIFHRIEIIRGDQVIDVTEQTRNISVLHREKDLEAQTIDGRLTATLQVEGLKVGDILRVVTSTRFKDPVLGDNVETSTALSSHPMKIAQARYRLIWPRSTPLAWRVTPVSTPTAVTQDGVDNELTIDLPLPKQPETPPDTPARFARTPMFEGSTFRRWEDVSMAEAKVYPTRGLIPPGGALAARVAGIAASSRDPLVRTAAAVRLVQDEIRYFADGQNEGNLVPQAPTDTWEKRYGDCKAKSLLLTAILLDLGIPAEPALTHASEGDLIPDRLPGFGAFNHMITRAVVNGRVYWLDGTLTGTRLADLGDAPPYHFALPVRTVGAALEPITYATPARPLARISADVDSRAGVGLPAPFRLEMTVRGAPVPQLKAVMGQVDPKKFGELIDNFIKTASPGFGTVSRRSVSFHDDDGTAEITAEGLAQLGWRTVGDQTAMQAQSFADSINLNVDRAKPAWRDIPVVLNAQSNIETHLRIQLPNQGAGFRIENPKTIDTTVAGFRLIEGTALAGGVYASDQIIKPTRYELPSADLAPAREDLARVKGLATRLIAPDNLPPYWKRLRAAYATKQTGPIEASLRSAIDQEPDDPQPLLRRATFYGEVGAYEPAVADLTRALAIKADASTYLFRAALYRYLDPAKAIADLNAAQAIEPTSPAVAIGLAKIHLLQHDPEAALRAIDQALPLQEDTWALRQQRAEALAISGKVADALKIEDELLAESPGKSNVLNGRCWLRAIARVDLENALADCSRGIEEAQNPLEIYDSRGFVYFRLQRYDEAIADLSAALRIQPGLAESMYVRGLARLAKGQKADGERDLHDAIDLEPDIEKVYALYGVVRPR